jgi:uncharacterized metal-binding protein YceD (DUF177 family)
MQLVKIKINCGGKIIFVCQRILRKPELPYETTFTITFSRSGCLVEAER